jgi:hypothetical protein
MPSTQDVPENITGISGILNTKKTKKGINPSNVEQEMLRNFRDTKVATDALDDYKREMKRIQEDTGMDFGETWDVDDLAGDKKDDISIDDDAIFGKNFATKKDPTDPNHELNKINRNLSKQIPHFKGTVPQKFGSTRQEPNLFGGTIENDSDSDDDLWNFEDKRKQEQPMRNNIEESNHEKQKYTKEQIRQRNNQRFMAKLDISEEDDDMFRQVEEEDEKQRILNQIDTLRNMLGDDDVDISHIPMVNNKSEMKDVQNAYKMLLTKNDTRRCSSMAEEAILMIAYALEDLFDGKRVLFGRFRPNLVGWHTTASTKLRRMRFETANVVSHVMQSYGIGDVGRIGLELIPSMVIYSKRKQNSSNEPDLQDTLEFTDALRDLHNK